MRAPNRHRLVGLLLLAAFWALSLTAATLLGVRL